jgi:4,5-DOPA dioxygenase extradiol
MISGRMPALFVGHGSPLNAIEDNRYTQGWQEIARRIPKPQAILSVSAHWYTNGTRINNDDNPKTVYDFYGFPEELYKVVYDVPGASKLANVTKELIRREVKTDNTWGIDHGTWSVLNQMYPAADIPVYQLSIDKGAPAEVHYNIGKELSSLRDKGVMIFGTGNVVHNLSRISWEMEESGFPWAIDFNEYIKDKIIKRQYEDVINYKQAGDSSKLAFITQEHYYPLLYVLGASKEEDQLRIWNDSYTFGSLSMTCYLFE